MNFFNKIGNKIKLAMFEPDKEPQKPIMPREEFERREKQSEEAVESLQKALEETEKSMTPEQKAEAERKRKQAEETRPWGM